MRVWQENRDFKSLILANKEICRHLGTKKIDDLFDVGYHLKYISAIFKRVFK